MIGWIVGASIVGVTGLVVLSSIKEIRPTERGLKERFGKYKKYCEAGWHFVLPVVESLRVVNITEQMVNAERQEVITEDNLNAHVDAQVYFKVKPNEEGVKASKYNVQNYEYQIVQLARTTLRNIIGTLNLKEVNSERDKINHKLTDTLRAETKNWGIEVIRTELKEIEPPEDVQSTMNEVVKAENEKIASVNRATARETVADGERRALIKVAEGEKKSEILRAEGKAQSIKLVNESASKYFKGNAQLLKKLEVTRDSLVNNSKIVIPSNSKLINVIGETGITPILDDENT